MEQMNKSILDLLNCAEAAELQQQSLADASAALESIVHAGSSWEECHHAVHYAFGSTAIVGLTQISTLLEQAETKILNKNKRALAMIAEKLASQLRAFEGNS
jgi:hypothetical protein